MATPETVDSTPAALAHSSGGISAEGGAPSVLQLRQRPVGAPSPSFSGDGDDFQTLVRQLPQDQTVFIPAGVTVGDISVDGGQHVVVRGVVQGNIKTQAGKIAVLEGGEVRGRIDNHNEVIVAGKVQTAGASDSTAIDVKGRVWLTATAHVIGDVLFESVRIMDGATPDGAMRPANRRTS